MDRWKIYAIIAAIIVAIGLVLGFRFAGLLAAIGIGGAVTERKKAKERIEKAGDEVDPPEHFDNPDDAADYIDDLFDSDNGGE